MNLNLSAFPFYILLVSSMGMFADFIIGKNSRKENKDRLTDWYVKIDDSSWDFFGKFSARTTLSFFDWAISRSFRSKTFWFRIIFLSIFINTVALFTAYPNALKGTFIDFRPVYLGKGLAPAVLLSLVIDVLSFTLTYKILNSCVRANSGIISIVLIAIDILIGYFLFFVTYTILQIYWTVYVGAPMAFFDVTKQGFTYYQSFLFGMNALGSFLFYPPLSGLHGGFNWGLLFGFSALFPSLFHFVLETICLFLITFKKILKPTLIFFIDRLDELDTNFIITKVSFFFSTSISLLYLLLKWLTG